MKYNHKSFPIVKEKKSENSDCICFRKMFEVGIAINIIYINASTSFTFDNLHPKIKVAVVAIQSIRILFGVSIHNSCMGL